MRGYEHIERCELSDGFVDFDVHRHRFAGWQACCCVWGDSSPGGRFEPLIMHTWRPTKRSAKKAVRKTADYLRNLEDD